MHVNSSVNSLILGTSFVLCLISFSHSLFHLIPDLQWCSADLMTLDRFVLEYTGAEIFRTAVRSKQSYSL